MYLIISSNNCWGLYPKKPFDHGGFGIQLHPESEYIEAINPRTGESYNIFLNLDGYRLGDKVEINWGGEKQKNSTVPKNTVGHITSLVVDCHGNRTVTLDVIHTPVSINRLKLCDGMI